MKTSKFEYVSTFSDSCDDADLRQKTDMDLYLRAMFVPLVKKHFPQHYFVESIPESFRAYFESRYPTHKYFLRFNIDTFYQTVVGYSIGPVLLKNFEVLYGSDAPGHLHYHLSPGPNQWFSKPPWISGFPYEKNLLYTATGIYLLGLCKAIKRWPFLCYNDEFVVLFPFQSEINDCLELVRLELGRLNLKLNTDATHSGEVDEHGFCFADIDWRRDQLSGYKFENKNKLEQP